MKKISFYVTDEELKAIKLHEIEFKYASHQELIRKALETQIKADKQEENNK